VKDRSKFAVGDRARAFEIDRRSAEKMKDAYGALESLTTDADEIQGRSLKPRRHHAPIAMPQRLKPLPIAGIAQTAQFSIRSRIARRSCTSIISISLRGVRMSHK
jgi:hypothetical protein